MFMKWIGGPNHNHTVWLVPRCDTHKTHSQALTVVIKVGVASL